jgi:hypothetical protein
VPTPTDYITPYLDVYPYDGSTAVTLEVRPPDPAVPFPVTPITPSIIQAVIDGAPTAVQRWTAAPVATGEPYGWWVLAWDVTGTGAGAPEESVFVAPPPVPGGPVWTPTRPRVASYVPSRPLVPLADGSNADVMTFDDSTRPTGGQVDQLVVDAVNWVTDACGAIDASLGESATACAAIRAAAFVELGYPERDVPMRSSATNTAQVLFAQADRMLAALKARNEAVTGTDPDLPAGLLPLYSFPPACPYGDYVI